MTNVDAWNQITRSYLSRADTTEYVELFKLQEMLDGISSPRDVDELIFFFAIEDNPKNRRQLETALGRDWRDNFVRKLRLPDDEDQRKRAYSDPDENNYESILDAVNRRSQSGNSGDYDFTFNIGNLFATSGWEDIPSSISSGWDETMYKYFIKPSFFDKMNNEVAGIILTMGIDISIGYEEAEWWEKVLQIILIIVITWVTAGSGTYAAIAYFAAAVQVIAILFDLELPMALNIAISIISLNPSAIATMAPMKLMMLVANKAIEIAIVYQDMTFQDDLKKEKKKYEDIRDEFDEAQMEADFRFTFGTGFFKSYMNDGVHKDPNTFYYETYNEFAIYKNTSYNMWDQID